MALKSMTGFGLAESVTPTGTYRVELKAVNNRYLETQLRLPRTLSVLEQKVRKVVGESVSRGYLTVMVNHSGVEEETSLTWDRAAVADYVSILRQVQKEHALAGELTLANLQQFSDFVKTEVHQLSEKTLWRDLKPVIAAALEAFQKSRLDEGRHTEKHLRMAIRGITTALGKIEKRAPVRLKAYEDTLRARIDRLIHKSEKVDPGRVAMEVAMLADKLDLSEECSRLKAHLAKFLEALESTDPVGKHLGFLLQEMNREANTICSKANDARIAHWGVSLKEFVEQIREQVQNIE